MKLVLSSELETNLGAILPKEAVKTYMFELLHKLMIDFPPHRVETYHPSHLLAYKYFNAALDYVCAEHSNPILENKYLDLFRSKKDEIKQVIIDTLLPCKK